MIEKFFFKAEPMIYFRDLFLSILMFMGGFIGAAYTSDAIYLASYALCVIGLHRAGVFGHELTHRPNDKSMRPFYWFWNMTIGCIIMVPSSRFFQPHKLHHQTGKFRTKDDPQYLLVRSDAKIAFFVLFVLPFITPLFGLFQIIIASIGGIKLEEAIDQFSRKWFNFSTGTPIPEKMKNEVVWLSRLSLVYFLCFVILIPQYISFYYAVLVGAWFLIVLRIPLEHELEKYAESSVQDDQMFDSFSVESPLAIIIQPIGFRFHTAHHMYPGVPYHNLPSLHEHLKATLPAYNNSVVSYWELIKGPKYKKEETVP
jgi:fatty acid desaturase